MGRLGEPMKLPQFRGRCPIRLRRRLPRPLHSSSEPSRPTEHTLQRDSVQRWTHDQVTEDSRTSHCGRTDAGCVRNKQSTSAVAVNAIYATTALRMTTQPEVLCACTHAHDAWEHQPEYQVRVASSPQTRGGLCFRETASQCQEHCAQIVTVDYRPDGMEVNESDVKLRSSVTLTRIC